MKKIHNYIMLLFIAFAVASCAEEEIIENKVVGKPGEEVKFSLSLNKKSRTVYGDEINNTFPIYWVDGDKVQVYSPDASSSRNNAEYKVILPKGENGVVVEKPDYAGDLEKTGDYGVQWGNGDVYVDDENVEHTGVHDFYSIYPSGNYKFSEDDKENMIASGLRVKTVQEISYVDGTYTHDMSNCLMYATTPKVDMEDAVVNLSYHPLSTVLWFDVTAFKDNTLQDAQQTNFMITGIELEYTGTEGAIAGAFNYDVTNGKFIDFEEPYNKISVRLYDKSGTQELSHTVKAGEPVNFPIFLAPSDLDLSNLKITINTDNGTFTKTLSGTTNFKPGKIHKITLPKLSKTSEGWDVSKWMTYVPRNVYLSEISIPGSWNSLNPEFQGTSPSVSVQYGNGVRAFHLDTRWTSSANLSGLGLADKYFKVSDISSSNTYLSVADGGGGRHVRDGNYAWSTSLGQMMERNNPSFETRLKEVVENVKSDEYMIVFCSFAHESFNDTSKTGMTWMQAVSDACENVNNNTDSKYYGKIYDASELTSNTVVGDVLGKVIVIVNCETSVTDITLPLNSLCLFVSIPNKLSSDYFPTDGFKSDALHSSSETLDITLAVSQAQITSSTNSSYTHLTRGYYPTFTQRTNVVNDILDWSMKNYGTDDYAHDKWIFLGLGGNTANSSTSDGDSGTADDVAETYNTLINNCVTKMGTIPEGSTAVVPYYPVGIVLMNYVNDNAPTVKNILLLNNKYRLQYDSKKPVDYNPLYWTPGTGDGEGGEGGDGI